MVSEIFYLDDVPSDRYRVLTGDQCGNGDRQQQQHADSHGHSNRKPDPGQSPNFTVVT